MEYGAGCPSPDEWAWGSSSASRASGSGEDTFGFPAVLVFTLSWSTALRLWRTWHGPAIFFGVGLQGPLDELSDHVIICGSEDAFVNFAEQVRVRLNACVHPKAG